MISKQQQKYVQSLHNKKYRQEYGEFIVEGEKNILELIDSEYEIKDIFCSQDFEKELKKNGKQLSLTTGTEEQINAISTLKNQNSGVAVVKIKEPENISTSQNLRLILDGIKDPGNLGTIIRLADWYGLKQIYCSEDTVEFYNPKVISATMGSFSRISCVYLNIQDFLKNNPGTTYGAYLGGTNIHDLKPSNGVNLIIGSESHGIREEILPYVSEKITIPGFGKAESLNAAIATGIILDNFSRFFK
ncbi:MAG: RNA methyltransferase [Cytophagaceae bacterium]|nr:RNA methyltransferase [Cytophagaceae bacterium]